MMVVCFLKVKAVLSEPTKVYGKEKSTLSFISVMPFSLAACAALPFLCLRRVKVEQTKPPLWSQTNTCCVNKEQ